jgi:hypothetical protein
MAPKGKITSLAYVQIPIYRNHTDAVGSLCDGEEITKLECKVVSAQLVEALYGFQVGGGSCRPASANQWTGVAQHTVFLLVTGGSQGVRVTVLCHQPETHTEPPPIFPRDS